MAKQLIKYDINQCALYKCRSKKRLERLLRLDEGDLKHIGSIINYHSFEIAKKHSQEKRAITAPDYTLKLVQKRILRLLQRVIRPEWLISGEKGKSYIDNGKAHLTSRYVLTIDIKKFYDNCAREPVYKFFLNVLKTSPDVAKLLADIVTYNAGIPTGCPTSQIIAFYAYSEMFTAISEMALKHGCKFTLYVDDMTFSSQEPFSRLELQREVDCILRRYGHKPKYSKVKYYGPSDYKPITGTIVTPKHTLAVPNRLQETIYNSFQDLKGATGTSDENSRISTLRGQIQAARQIESGKFSDILRLTDQIQTQS